MALSDGDRAWLEDKFSILHKRISEEDSKVHKLDVRTTLLEKGSLNECSAAIAKHVKDSVAHNPVKAVGLIAGIIGLFEAAKKFFHF